MSARPAVKLRLRAGMRVCGPERAQEKAFGFPPPPGERKFRDSEADTPGCLG